MQPAPYTIHAVQYAQRNTTSTELFVGDTHNTPMKMAYFVWALTNGAQTVVVDLGFTEAVGTRRGRQAAVKASDVAHWPGSSRNQPSRIGSLLCALRHSFI